MKKQAEILHEYGPFPGVERIHGVTFDGERVWFAAGDELVAFDPTTGERSGSVRAPSDAGTAFDGEHLYQLAEAEILKIEPDTGRVVARIPAPGQGCDSGMAWAEGSLWVGQYQERKIHEIDPATGKILRTIESNRFVTGVTWVDGELWHGTLEEDRSELRRVNAETGAVEEQLELPEGVVVTGLESDGSDRLFCGGGRSARVRAVRRPARQR